MYKGKVLGKPVKINNKDYKQLLERFNLDNIEIGWGYHIKVKCPFCYRYSDYVLLDRGWGELERPYCKPKCPFSQFETDDNVGCMDVIKSFDERSFFLVPNQYLHIGPSHISWNSEVDKQVRNLITKIRTELLKMKKEEK